jgi:acylphosphatase
MKKRLVIRVYGTVQGVFFRHSACIKAGELGLVGFIRNEPDGSVYAEAEGESPALEKFFEWCQTGPPHAAVARVDVSLREADGTFEAFAIR